MLNKKVKIEKKKTYEGSDAVNFIIPIQKRGKKAVNFIIPIQKRGKKAVNFIIPIQKRGKKAVNFIIPIQKRGKKEIPLQDTKCIFQHYENLPMQYTEIFSAVKFENFTTKNLIFLIFLLQNKDCGYTLEPPRRGCSNEYPNLCFGAKIRKIGIPYQIPVFQYKSGVQRSIHVTDMFPDDD